MSDGHRSYFDSVDWAALQREHPIGDDFVRMATTISRDELRARQNALFLRCVARAWKTPFYRRLWGGVGAAAGDIRSLDDLPRLPRFDKSDLMESIAASPPFGDFAGFESYDVGARPPVIFHTTSGTTGTPQVILFGPKSREAQNLLLGRLYRFQGLKPDDVVHSVYGHGMINGGHYVREAVTHWTSAIFMSAGTGVETRSARQVELMRDFRATAIVGFADYIKKLAEVARESGIVPGRDIRIRMISGHLGREDKEQLSRAWGGAECYDWYGVGDTGTIAGEGPDRDGLYVMEDAQYLEVCDIETGVPVADGVDGDMVVTCLYKDDLYPVIRFNTHDVTRVRAGASSIGVNFRRIEGFLGRSDNMVKVKGINVFPQAIGPMLEEHPAFLGEFICRARRDASGREEFVVVGFSDPEGSRVGARCERRTRRRLRRNPEAQARHRRDDRARRQGRARAADRHRDAPEADPADRRTLQMTAVPAPLSVSRLSAAFAAGETDPVEAMKASLAAIDSRNAALGVFLDLRRVAALAEAGASAMRRRRGAALSAIDGIAFGVKANIAVAGLPLHAGIAAYKDDIAGEDAAVVAALRSKGAIPLGIVNMHEGALGATSDNPHFGRCRNPLDPRLTPGGSSGGSAAAVAAGFVPFALGTDTMGSVRIPSAYCGIAGLKPSKDALSMRGVLPLSPTLDHVGLHAAGAADIALVFDTLSPFGAMAEPDVAIADFGASVDVDDDIADGFRAAASVLDRGGRRARVDVSGFEFGALRRRGLLVSEVEGLRIHAQRLAESRAGFSADFAAMLDYGGAQPKSRVDAAYDAIAEAGAHFTDIVRRAGVLMAPTAPQGPFPFEAGTPANQADFTCLANFAGLPAVAVPATASGAPPASVQFIASRGEDQRALAAAAAFERARDG